MGRHRRPAVEKIASSGGDAVRIDQHRALERRRQRMGHRIGVEARDRRVEIVIGDLVHRLAEFGADAAHRPGLVDDQKAMGLRNALGDRCDVERHDGAEVDHLGLDALGGERFRRLERLLHELAGGDDGEIACPAGRSAPRRTARSDPRLTGTSPLEANSALGSSISTGSEARSAVFISPLASAGLDGTQTIRPGTCAHIG